MSLLPQFAGSYVGAFAEGLLYGLVFCTSSCLPYVASYIAGIGAGFRKGVAVTVIFNSGRITAYALIGAAIGIFKVFVSDRFLASFQIYSSFAFALVTIAIGTIILLRIKANDKGCNVKNNQNVGLIKPGRRFDFGAFSLGFSRGLILCPPLFALLAYAVTFATPVDSFLLAVFFGLGTALSPMIVLGGATGWLLKKAPLFRKWISLAGAIILVVLGVGTLINLILVSNQ
jgi:cytochrome c-type biogenesis protein